MPLRDQPESTTHGRARAQSNPRPQLVEYNDHNLGPRKYGECTVRTQDYFWAKCQQGTSLWYNLGSRVAISWTIGLLRTFINLGVKNITVVNRDAFVETISDPERSRPVLTYSNHLSTFDDPVIWGLLPKSVSKNPDLMRWTLGAKELTFINPPLTAFFTMGQVIPTIRGAGIYQSAMNLAVSKLNEKKWVHIFPEGYVNQSGKIERFKWGISRLILESEQVPIIIPIYHSGLDEIFPLTNKHRYPVLVPRDEKFLYLEFGNPVDLAPILAEYHTLKKKKQAELDKQEQSLDFNRDLEELNKQFRIRIAQHLFDELAKMKSKFELESQQKS